MTTAWRRLCVDVLEASAPEDKCELAAAALAQFNPTISEFDVDGWLPPARPARPSRPRLMAPGDVPKRKAGGIQGRVALLHAIAHIELNAIDLAFDMAARFAGQIAAAGLNAPSFIRDWVEVGADEARHFTLLQKRLGDFGAAYGDLDAHDGLWEAALNTSDDVAARLAIGPLVLESRGLDVSPGMIDRLQRAGDKLSAEILQTIYQEEHDHVRKGAYWFGEICRVRQHDPAETFRRLVAERFAGDLKPPFNHEARTASGIPLAFYIETVSSAKTRSDA